MWRYWWYGDLIGPDPWRAWYDAQDAQVRGKHDNVFRILESRSDWREPHAKKLDDGMLEIILKGKVQHRLLGFCWPTANFEFIFVLPCTHKGVVYKPKNALKTARERKKELIAGSRG
jgi:Phage derived protein Gp49-like (DUF891)